MHLVFLKLGGSLITDKNRALTPRPDILARLAGEIAEARQACPDLRLVFGHGSGSFGHMTAHQYGTRRGVSSPEEWAGFAEVWRAARLLNQIVIESLIAAGLPAVAFPPSACTVTEDGRPVTWNLEPLQAALESNMVPVVNGDVTFDTRRGGTILSTEDVFVFLAPHLRPARILLAGIEEGVWADYPACTRLMPVITTSDDPQAAISGSSAVDVTGGMAEKVNLMLASARQVQGLEALIFSGSTPGLVRQALCGAAPGTVIRSTTEG